MYPLVGIGVPATWYSEYPLDGICVPAGWYSEYPPHGTGIRGSSSHHGIPSIGGVGADEEIHLFGD